MWGPMTVLALGNHLVFCLVAECACQGLVLGHTGAEKVKGLLVTCAAVF